MADGVWRAVLGDKRYRAAPARFARDSRRRRAAAPPCPARRSTCDNSGASCRRSSGANVDDTVYSHLMYPRSSPIFPAPAVFRHCQRPADLRIFLRPVGRRGDLGIIEEGKVLIIRLISSARRTRTGAALRL